MKDKSGKRSTQPGGTEEKNGREGGNKDAIPGFSSLPFISVLLPREGPVGGSMSNGSRRQEVWAYDRAERGCGGAERVSEVSS